LAYKEHFGGKVLTVWSAPNYCYRFGNKAAILVFLTGKKQYKLLTIEPSGDSLKLESIIKNEVVEVDRFFF